VLVDFESVGLLNQKRIDKLEFLPVCLCHKDKIKFGYLCSGCLARNIMLKILKSIVTSIFKVSFKTASTVRTSS